MTKSTKRSLRASSVGIIRANKAILSFASKVELVAKLEISRTTVQNFLTGKPIGAENFYKICQKLELPWQEIVDKTEYTADEPQAKATDNTYYVDTLVQDVRHKGHTSIQQKCGKMQVLDMLQPIELNDIYTSVNILEKISSRRRLDIADLLKVCVSDDFERPGLDRIFEQRVPGLEAVKQYSKLMVLGKPGSGKTTFLNHIAIQCSLGKFQANKVPVFITLKDFAQAMKQLSLLEYITEEFATYGITDTTVAEQLLSQGRVLILLDGLDEVMETDWHRVLQEVRNFSTQFHANHLVIACRIAALEDSLEQFTEVEVADFDEQQIASFATKWFASKDPSRGKKFIQKINEKHSIRELANNPLLLTFLCLVFEESVDLPCNHSELYEEGLELLLKKWDAKRNVERDQVYKKLSLQHKENLLSQIARTTFEQGKYFFRQKELEHYIADYIRNLPDVNTQVENLQKDSEAVLKSLEVQHGLLVERAMGIYSFSHLTFQEYFTAKEIVNNSHPQTLDIALRQMASRITETRWHEVFLLVPSMLSNADYVLQLIKQEIDGLICQHKHLQKFLTWLSQKSYLVDITDKLATVRAFYLDLSIGLDLKINPVNCLALKLDPVLSFALNHDLELDLELNFALTLARTFDFTLTRTLNFTLARILGFELESQLHSSLQGLKDQLPDPDKGEESLKKWYTAKGQAWAEQLSAIQMKYRNIGQSWQFSDQQKKALQQYHDANKLLVDCLKSGCYITYAVRNEIEETLLLPIAEIEQRKGALNH